MPKRLNLSSKKSKVGLHSLDMLGSKFSMNFSTSTGRFQTQMGGIITILLGLISIATFLVVMSQYFDRSSPVVTNSTESGSKVVKFDFYKEDLYPIVGLNLLGNYIT